MWLSSLCLFVICFTLGNSVPVQQKSEGQEVVLQDFEKLCAKGPQVWCQNPLTAKQCGALDHCLQTVWQTQVLEADSSNMCQSCMTAVENTKELFTKNVTVDQARIVLETICRIAPPLLSLECVYGVDKGVPELQKLIESVRPHAFCTMLFLCNVKQNEVYLTYRGVEMKSLLEVSTPTTEIATVPASSEEVSKDDISCADCHTFFTTSQYMYNDSKTDDVLNAMLKLCGQLSSFSDFCSAMVQSNFQMINERIKSAKAQDFCHYMPACSKNYHYQIPTTELIEAEKSAPKVANDETCDFCISIVQHLRDILTANTTKDEFHKVLQGLCNQLGNYKAECSDLVDQYYELIYTFITEEVDGKEICAEIKICPKPSITSELPVIGRDEAQALEVSKTTVKPDLHGVKLTGGKREHLLGANKCTWGPSYWCTNMRTTKECSVPVKHCIPSWENLKLAEDNGEICKVCKDMVQQARDQLRSNETQEELKEVFEGSCKLIPVKIARKECIKVVDEFVPELIETLSSQMNPQIVCATAGLCNNAKMDLLFEQGKKEEMEQNKKVDLPIERMMPPGLTTALYGNKEAVSRATEACELCELLLHFVQQQITLPASEKEIKKVVEEVCIKMSKTISTQCSKFVEEYGDSFIALLAQRIDPTQVCPNIGACMQLIDNVKPTCPLCMLAVKSLEQAVANNKTEENIKEELDRLCKHLPTESKNDCERFVNTFSEDLINALMADFSEKEVCAYLKLCSAEVFLSEDVETFAPVTSKPVVKTDAPITAKVPKVVEDVKTTTKVVNDVTPANVETNEVSENIAKDKQKCVLCEFVLQKLDQDLKDKKTEDEIKHAVHLVCTHMPRTVVDQCNSFINQYADLILHLLADSLEPKQICTKIGLCMSDSSAEQIEGGNDKCLACEALIGALQAISEDPKMRRSFNREIMGLCLDLPKKLRYPCQDVVYQLAPQIEAILAGIPLGPLVCYRALDVCRLNRNYASTPDVCNNGPKFWCQSTSNAVLCGTTAIEHCQEKVWKGDKPMKRKNDNMI